MNSIKSSNANTPERKLFKSPRAIEKRRTRRDQKFKGKLSHKLSSSKITEYFSTQSSETVDEATVIPNTANRTNVSPCSSPKKNILQQSNVTNEIVQNVRTKDSYEERSTTVVCESVQQDAFSPSTAFSHLRITRAEKKKSKVRRRLPIAFDNSTTDDRPPKNYDELFDCDVFLSLEKSQQLKLTDYFPVRRSFRKTEKIVLEEKLKSIEEAVLSEKEEGMEVRAFTGKGRGVVSTRRFEKGEFVVEYAGELVSLEVAREREAMYARDENTGCYMYYFTYKNAKYCIDATAESSKYGRLINHSRNGNLCPKTIEINGSPRIVLIAKVDIIPGVELTYDYGDRSKISLQYHPWLAQ